MSDEFDEIVSSAMSHGELTEREAQAIRQDQAWRTAVEDKLIELENGRGVPWQATVAMWSAFCFLGWLIAGSPGLD